MAYNSFEKLLQTKYYNDIFKKVDNYIYNNRSEISVKSYTIDNPNYKKLDDFTVKKVLSREIRGGVIVSELQVVASLEIKGHTKYSYETDSANLWLIVTVEYKLDEGIHDFNNQSAHLFSSIEPLIDAVQQGLKQVKNSWNSSTRSFVIPEKEKLSWAEGVNKKWEQRIDLVEAGIDYLIKPDFISKGAGAIHPYAKTAYLMGKSYMSAVSKDYKKSGFMKYGKLGKKANENLQTAWRSVKKLANEKNWKWYAKLGSKWKKGSFNQFLSTFHHSITSKAANFKVFGKYPVKNINSVLGKMTDPIKTYGKKLIETVSKSKIGSKLKFVGKAAKVLGWVAVGVDVTVTSVREFNNKDSRAYGSVGKSLIHAGVAQLKSAGPIEGALIGAKAGPWGALAGFAAGTINTVWGIVSPDTKNAFYSGVQNVLDDGYDFIADGVGKAVKGTWNSVTSWFGGGAKYA